MSTKKQGAAGGLADQIENPATKQPGQDRQMGAVDPVLRMASDYANAVAHRIPAEMREQFGEQVLVWIRSGIHGLAGMIATHPQPPDGPGWTEQLRIELRSLARAAVDKVVRERTRWLNG